MGIHHWGVYSSAQCTLCSLSSFTSYPSCRVFLLPYTPKNVTLIYYECRLLMKQYALCARAALIVLPYLDMRHLGMPYLGMLLLYSLHWGTCLFFSPCIYNFCKGIISFRIDCSRLIIQSNFDTRWSVVSLKGKLNDSRYQRVLALCDLF